MPRFDKMSFLAVWLAAVLMFEESAAGGAGAMPPVDASTPIYEVKVEPGVSYDDVITSLKVAAEGKNLVSPATFSLAQHLQQRGVQTGVLEVRSYCNLSLGSEIFLDHPEFAVFAPCRIAIYEKHGQLYLALDRPTFDLKYIQHPTPRAQKAAQQLEDILMEIVDKARKGEI